MLFLAGRRHGRERAPVEGALEGDDLVALRVPEFSRELDGRFVGFRARVAEKDFSGERVLDYLFRQYPLPLMVVVVGYVYQLGGLFPYSLDDARMTVPYPAYRPSGEKIEVLFSLLVPDFRPLAARKYERRFSVRRDDVCFVQVDDIFFVHTVLTISVPIPLSVNISRRRPCGIFASIMCVFATPSSSACVQAFTLGIMPPEMTPESMNPATSAVVA